MLTAIVAVVVVVVVVAAAASNDASDAILRLVAPAPVLRKADTSHLPLFRDFLASTAGGSFAATPLAAQYAKRIGRTPPPNFDAWTHLVDTNNCANDLRFYRQLFDDLEPFRSAGGITPAMLHKARSLLGPQFTAVLQAKGSRLVGRPPAWASFLLDESVLALLPPDFEILINTLDEPRSLPTDSIADEDTPYISAFDQVHRNKCLRDTLTPSHTSNDSADLFSYVLNMPRLSSVPVMIPIFSQSKHPCYKDILMPMAYHVKVNAVRDTVPWNEKRNVVFWRGSTTGGEWTGKSTLHTSDRMRLVDWAKMQAIMYPETHGIQPPSSHTSIRQLKPYKVDIGFHQTVQCSGGLCAAIKAVYPFRPKVSFTQTLGFKFLVLVDGNTWAERVQDYFQTRSVIVGFSRFIDWASHNFIPGKHYLVTRPDYRDLDHVIEDAIQRDDEMRRLAQERSILAQLHNTVQQQQCYSALLLMEYFELVRMGKEKSSFSKDA